MTDTTQDAELFTPRFFTTPYEPLAALRELAPVVRVAMPGGFPVWYVTRYDEVREAFFDPRLSRDRVHWKAFHEGRIPMSPEVLLTSGRNMFTSEPPEHTRLRNLVSKAFSIRRIEQLRPRTEQVAAELVDGLGPEADLVEEYAVPLPLTMICELFGVPPQDRESLRRWTGTLTSSESSNEEAAAAVTAIDGYLATLAEARRRKPADDLTTDLVQVTDDGRGLSEEELVAMLSLLLSTGHETTLNLIGNALHAFLTHPDQLDLVRREPGRWDDAVEELLRWQGSLVHSIFRYTTEDVELGGVLIPAGEAVVVSMAGANRDPRRFPDPDAFDLTREDRAHMAFGHGIHYCIGAPLARMETSIATRYLFERRDVRLAVPADEVRWRPSPVSRGLAALPVRLSPPGAVG